MDLRNEVNIQRPRLVIGSSEVMLHAHVVISEVIVVNMVRMTAEEKLDAGATVALIEDLKLLDHVIVRQSARTIGVAHYMKTQREVTSASEVHVER